MAGEGREREGKGDGREGEKEKKQRGREKEGGRRERFHCLFRYTQLLEALGCQSSGKEEGSN